MAKDCIIHSLRRLKFKSSFYLSTLKKEAKRSSETSSNTTAIRCPIAEDCFHQSHSRQYLRSIFFLLPWKWRGYVPPKHRLTSRLQASTSQKTAFLIIIYVKIKNELSLSFYPEDGKTRSSETSPNTTSGKCHIQEDFVVHSHSRQNLKSYFSTALKMDAIRSHETSDNTASTQFLIPKDCILHSHHRQNFKSIYIPLYPED
jgi:hypothetical protein